MSDEAKRVGRVVQVTGPVVDVEFPSGHLPDLLNAIKIDTESEGIKIHLTLEAAQHLGNNTVRCVAMSGTDGLRRGMPAVDTGQPISVPVGRNSLGRIFNVLGETIDGGGPVETDLRLPIHRPAPSVSEVEPATQILE